jgi:hypothetical protein
LFRDYTGDPKMPAIALRLPAGRRCLPVLHARITSRFVSMEAPGVNAGGRIREIPDAARQRAVISCNIGLRR